MEFFPQVFLTIQTQIRLQRRIPRRNRRTFITRCTTQTHQPQPNPTPTNLFSLTNQIRPNIHNVRHALRIGEQLDDAVIRLARGGVVLDVDGFDESVGLREDGAVGRVEGDLEGVDEALAGGVAPEVHGYVGVNEGGEEGEEADGKGMHGDDRVDVAVGVVAVMNCAC